MGCYEYDRIRTKNSKHINNNALTILNELANKKANINKELENKLTMAKNEVEIDIINKAKEIYTWRRSMKEIERRFGPYKRPTEDNIPKFKAIQEKSLELALLIEQLCPFCREKSSALTLLQQAKMSANAAIAIYSEEKHD